MGYYAFGPQDPEDFLPGKDEKSLLSHTYLYTPVPPDTHSPLSYACGSSGSCAGPQPLGLPPPGRATNTPPPPPHPPADPPLPQVLTDSWGVGCIRTDCSCPPVSISPSKSPLTCECTSASTSAPPHPNPHSRMHMCNHVHIHRQRHAHICTQTHIHAHILSHPHPHPHHHIRTHNPTYTCASKSASSQNIPNSTENANMPPPQETICKLLPPNPWVFGCRSWDACCRDVARPMNASSQMHHREVGQ